MSDFEITVRINMKLEDLFTNCSFFIIKISMHLND